MKAKIPANAGVIERGMKKGEAAATTKKDDVVHAVPPQYAKDPVLRHRYIMGFMRGYQREYDRINQARGTNNTARRDNGNAQHVHVHIHKGILGI